MLQRNAQNRWAEISSVILGRPDNSIKNFWNSMLRHRIGEMTASLDKYLDACIDLDKPGDEMKYRNDVIKLLMRYFVYQSQKQYLTHLKNKREALAQEKDVGKERKMRSFKYKLLDRALTLVHSLDINERDNPHRGPKVSTEYRVQNGQESPEFSRQFDLKCFKDIVTNNENGEFHQTFLRNHLYQQIQMALLEQEQLLLESPPHLELLEQFCFSKQEFSDNMKFFGDVGNIFQAQERQDLNTVKKKPAGQNSPLVSQVSADQEQPRAVTALRQAPTERHKESEDHAKIMKKRAPNQEMVESKRHGRGQGTILAELLPSSKLISFSQPLVQRFYEPKPLKTNNLEQFAETSKRETTISHRYATQSRAGREQQDPFALSTPTGFEDTKNDTASNAALYSHGLKFQPSSFEEAAKSDVIQNLRIPIKCHMNDEQQTPSAMGEPPSVVARRRIPATSALPPSPPSKGPSISERRLRKLHSKQQRMNHLSQGSSTKQSHSHPSAYFMMTPSPYGYQQPYPTYWDQSTPQQQHHSMCPYSTPQMNPYNFPSCQSCVNFSQMCSVNEIVPQYVWPPGDHQMLMRYQQPSPPSMIEGAGQPKDITPDKSRKSTIRSKNCRSNGVRGLKQQEEWTVMKKEQQSSQLNQSQTSSHRGSTPKWDSHFKNRNQQVKSCSKADLEQQLQHPSRGIFTPVQSDSRTSCPNTNLRLCEPSLNDVLGKRKSRLRAGAEKSPEVQAFTAHSGPFKEAFTLQTNWQKNQLNQFRTPCEGSDSRVDARKKPDALQGQFQQAQILLTPIHGSNMQIRTRLQSNGADQPTKSEKSVNSLDRQRQSHDSKDSKKRSSGNEAVQRLFQLQKAQQTLGTDKDQAAQLERRQIRISSLVSEERSSAVLTPIKRPRAI